MGLRFLMLPLHLQFQVGTTFVQQEELSPQALVHEVVVTTMVSTMELQQEHQLLLQLQERLSRQAVVQVTGNVWLFSTIMELKPSMLTQARFMFLLEPKLNKVKKLLLSDQQGDQTGPHLHFEIVKSNGQKLNPAKHIR